MDVLRIFLKFEVAKQPLLSAAGCHTQPSKFQFFKKCAPNCHHYLQQAL
jgi:hypothetical protein